MSFRVRYTFPDGRTGRWARDYATREEAQRAIDGRVYDTGFAYFVEEVHDALEPKPEPTSTTERIVGLLRDRHARGLAKYGTTLDRTDLAPGEWAQHAIEEALDLAGYLMRLQDECGMEPRSTAAHHVEILRARVKELEEMVETLRKKLNETLTDNDDIHRELAFALDLGSAMREAMRTGEWRAGHDRSMANSAVAGWDRWKGSLSKAPSVPVGASEAPREGGDSDRRRLAVLNDWIRGGHRAFGFQNGIVVGLDGLCLRPVVEAPTLAAIADKLMEKESKP